MEQYIIFGVGLVLLGALLVHEYKRTENEEKEAHEAALAHYDPNKREKKRRIVVSSYMRAV